MSEWLGAFPMASSTGPIVPVPGWLAALDPAAHRCDGFRPALPFGTMQTPPPGRSDAPLPESETEALARAFAQGQAAGRAAAETEAADNAASQRALRLTFRALDEAAMGVLAEDLAATVMALAEGVLGEAAVDRDGLLARCTAAAQRIGGAAETLVLHLHPADIALIGPEALAGWRVLPDSAMTRGALRIEGPEGAVSDGPEDWRRAIAAAVRR